MTRNFRNLPNRPETGARAARRRPLTKGLAIAVLTALAILAGCVTARPGQVRGANATVDGTGIAGKTWLLAGYRFEGQFIPLEPGHGSAAKIVFRSDGTLSGFTGTNTFSGSWRAGKARSPGTRQFTATPSGLSKKPAPNEIASRFETDFLRELAAAKAIKITKDSIQLLDGQDGILLRFIAANANGLY